MTGLAATYNMPELRIGDAVACYGYGFFSNKIANITSNRDGFDTPSHIALGIRDIEVWEAHWRLKGKGIQPGLINAYFLPRYDVRVYRPMFLSQHDIQTLYLTAYELMSNSGRYSTWKCGMQFLNARFGTTKFTKYLTNDNNKICSYYYGQVFEEAIGYVVGQSYRTANPDHQVDHMRANPHLWKLIFEWIGKERMPQGRRFLVTA